MSRCKSGSLCLALCSLLLLICFPSAAQNLPANPPPHHAVFVFLQRTSAHVKRSKSEVFQKVVEDVFAHLQSMNVSIATDEFGGRRSSEDVMPFETVQKIARDSHADSLLYLTVDRPIAKWIRVLAYCYDSSGKLLWTEEAASGGGFTGAHGLRVTLERLHQRLDRHLGQDGLPLNNAQPPKESHER